jgi:acetoin utilization protein AcuB
MYVRDFMSKDVVTISPDKSVSDAFALMKENRVRRLPVVEGGALIGIVAYSDLLRASPSEATSLSIWEINYVLSKLKIRDIMKQNVITIGPDEPVEKAALLMQKNDIGAIPVVENGSVVGIITESDIFDAFIDVMGMGSKGSRITVAIPDKPGELLLVLQVIYEEGLNVRSLATFHAHGERPGEVVIRVDTEHPEDLVQKLKEKGISVVHYEVF